MYPRDVETSVNLYRIEVDDFAGESLGKSECEGRFPCSSGPSDRQNRKSRHRATYILGRIECAEAGSGLSESEQSPGIEEP